MTRGLCKKEFEFSIESASYAHLKLYQFGMVNEERERENVVLSTELWGFIFWLLCGK